MSVFGRSGGERLPSGPFDAAFRARWSDEVLAASPSQFSIRSCTEAFETSIEGTGQHAGASLPRICSEGGLRVTAQNGWPPRHAPAQNDEPVRRWKLDVIPPTDFVNTIPYPAGRIAPGATWEQSERWTVQDPGEAPRNLHRVVRWKLLGVEPGEGGPFARLVCDGDFDTRFAAAAPDGSESARGETVAKLRCAVRLSLADGATSAFRVDFDATGEVMGEGADGEGTMTSTAQGHVDGRVARAPLAESSQEVLEPATTPP